MPPSSARPQARVYVDGFNLYNGAVRRTPYKWLDLGRLCRLLLSDYSVVGIRYFTARVEDRPPDMGQAARQDTYLRALRTISGLTIHEGFFLHTSTRARLVTPIACLAVPACLPNPRTVQVFKSEEKGSDVNIASHLLWTRLTTHLKPRGSCRMTLIWHSRFRWCASASANQWGS